MKMGISLKINVSQIDKARLFKGKKGQYVDLTFFLDPDNPGQYGDHGQITQSILKEERDQGVKLPIIGNGKIFWTDGNQGQQGGYQPPPPQHQPPKQQYQPPKKGYDPQGQYPPEHGPSQGGGYQTPWHGQFDDSQNIPF